MWNTFMFDISAILYDNFFADCITGLGNVYDSFSKDFIINKNCKIMKLMSL